jgi:RES domain-containing protein
MILTKLEATAYRMHSPRWASQPKSGQGAATHGGRANRPRVAALYLALDYDTAIKEFIRRSELLRPGTLVSYQLKLERVVDFRHGFNQTWDPIWEDFNCDWEKLWFNDRIEPPSWVIGDKVIESGAKGILFNSVKKEGGHNLVIYVDQLNQLDLLNVVDPDHALPKNQSSWKLDQ